MKLKSKWFVVLLLAAGILFTGLPTHVNAEQRDGVFVHISHGADDPHRVLMALNMAFMMSKDHDVLVYCDIKGIEFVLKDSEDLTFSHFPSSKTSIKKLLKNGVTIMACPGCLKAAGKSPSDLAKGIIKADKEKFFSFTKGRIITLDY